MMELEGVLDTLRERIARYQRAGIGEQDTKAALVVPVLRALGWDVEDLEDVKLEYRRRPAVSRRLRALPAAEPAPVHRGEVARRPHRRRQVGEPDPGLRDGRRRRVGCPHRRQ
jgi:hypothetical protein